MSSVEGVSLKYGSCPCLPGMGLMERAEEPFNAR